MVALEGDATSASSVQGSLTVPLLRRAWMKLAAVKRHLLVLR